MSFMSYVQSEWYGQLSKCRPLIQKIRIKEYQYTIILLGKRPHDNKNIITHCLYNNTGDY